MGCDRWSVFLRRCFLIGTGRGRRYTAPFIFWDPPKRGTFHGKGAGKDGFRREEESGEEGGGSCEERRPRSEEKGRGEEASESREARQTCETCEKAREAGPGQKEREGRRREE